MYLHENTGAINYGPHSIHYASLDQIHFYQLQTGRHPNVMNNMKMENLLMMYPVYENPGYLSMIEPIVRPYFVMKFYQAFVQKLFSF